MAKVGVFCGQFVVVVMAIYCPASVLTDAVDTYYSMTNGFLDVVQPTSPLSGMNYSLNS